MTWSLFKGTTRRSGSARLSYRMVFEGSPYEPVTDADMVRSASGRISARVIGLSLKGQMAAYEVDIPRGRLTGGGIMATLTDAKGWWSRLFTKEPNIIGWLADDITDNDTSIPVLSEVLADDSGGVFWVDGEAIFYASTSAGSLDGCHRAGYSSHAAYHYAGTGAGLSTPQLTDWPAIWEGRRVSVYVYAQGDDPQGDGTLIWQGKIASEPESVGDEWTIQIDSIASILKRKLGGNFGQLEPRGVQIADNAATLTYIQWQEVYTSEVPGSATASRQQYGPATISGQWETNEDFVSDVNALITATIASVGVPMDGTLRAVSDGATGWHMELTPGVNAYCVQVSVQGLSDGPLGSAVGGWGQPQLLFSGGSAYQAPTIDPETTYYYYAPSEGIGGIPRGSIVRAGRLYLTDRVPSNVTSAVVSFGEEDPPSIGYAAQPATADSFFVGDTDDATASAFFALIGPGQYRWWTATNPPVVTLCLNFNELIGGGGNSLWNLMRRIIAMTAELGNLGVCPPLYESDWDSASWQVLSSGALPPVVNARSYLSYTPKALEDIIAEELKLAGYILGVDSSGALKLNRLRLAASTEVATVQLISNDIIRDRKKLKLSRGAFGVWNTFEFQDGYDPIQDASLGRDYVIRDQTASSASPSERQITSKPLSGYTGPLPVSIEDLISLANATLGTLGFGYAVTTMRVSARLWDVEIGDTVAITYGPLPNESGDVAASPQSPGGADGRTGIVIGWRAEFHVAEIELKILLSPRSYAGYVPSAEITSQTGSVMSWSLTLDPALFPTGTSADDHWAAGDLIQIWRFNGATSTVYGAVLTVTGNTMTILLSVPWTPSTDSWFATFPAADAGSMPTRQTRYAFDASADGVLEFAVGDHAADVFGP